MQGDGHGKTVHPPVIYYWRIVELFFRIGAGYGNINAEGSFKTKFRICQEITDGWNGNIPG